MSEQLNPNQLAEQGTPDGALDIGRAALLALNPEKLREYPRFDLEHPEFDPLANPTEGMTPQQQSAYLANLGSNRTARSGGQPGISERPIDPATAAKLDNPFDDSHVGPLLNLR